MIWIIIMVGLGVLGLAAFASAGALGELPPAIDSNPVGRIPADDLTAQSLSEVKFSIAMNGYDQAEVDNFMTAASDGKQVIAEDRVPPFSVVRRGYRRSEVDEVFTRIGEMRNNSTWNPQKRSEGTNGSDETTYR